MLTCPGTLHLSLSLSRPLAHFAFLCPLHVHQCVYLYLCLSWPLFTLPLFSVHLFISLMCLSHLLSQSLSACAGMFAPYTVLYFRLPGLTLSTFSFLSSPGPFPSTSPLEFVETAPAHSYQLVSTTRKACPQLSVIITQKGSGGQLA